MKHMFYSCHAYEIPLALVGNHLMCGEIKECDCIECLWKILRDYSARDLHKKVLLRMYDLERVKDYKVEFDDLLK